MNHFDTFNYDDELPAHMTDYYCERKCRKMVDYIPKLYGSKAIDLGCGTGRHVTWMKHCAGVKIIGVDKTKHQNSPKECFKIDFLDGLPFNERIFDFSFFINTLHHLKNREEQIFALREAARVVKPNGIIFIHEINFLNPVIAFYTKYVFEFFRKIDQGNEYWLSPKIFREVPELVEIDRVYFTFTPDWCPKFLLPLFRKIDEWTDNKWIARFGAHVMYVFRRV